MTKRIAQFIVISLALAGVCAAQYPGASGWCEQGNGTVTIGGVSNSFKVQKSYPQCTVTVYLPGTTTKATIFSNATGTATANPFTASTAGAWLFYASSGIYDIQFSGTGIASPFTTPGVSMFYLSNDGPFSTFAAACTAAGVQDQTLIVTKPWTNLTTADYHLTCPNIVFLGNGSLQPAASQVLTLSPQFTCGTYQQCFDVSASGSRIAFSSAPTEINPNWVGADWTGTAVSTTAITASVAMAQAANCPLHFPAGAYKHGGFTISGGIVMLGDSQFKSQLVSDSAVTLSTPSGSLSNLGFKSISGSGTAAVGLDIRFATEFAMTNVYFGGGPSLGYAVGIRTRAAGGMVIDSPTTSFCNTGLLADFDSSANSGLVIRNADWFLAPNAGVQLTDVGAFSMEDSYCEAVQNCILVDNTSGPAIATGVISINHNRALLLPSSSGHTFTNPQFLNVNVGNAANQLSIDNFHITNNNVQSGETYCNTFTKTGMAAGTWKFFFSGNTWIFGCATAIMTGDLASIVVQAANETRNAGGPEFAGSMIGNDTEISATTAYNITQVYSGSTYVTLEVPVITHATPPTIAVAGDCGTNPAFFANSNDRAGGIQIGTGAVTSCKVTFGNAFTNSPFIVPTLLFNGTGTATINPGYPGTTTYFTIQGTALQGSSVFWTIPRGN